MSKLKGRVALVTGASKGIGAGIAKELSAAGAAVVVNYATDRAVRMPWCKRSTPNSNGNTFRKRT